MAFGWTRPISVFGSQIRKPKISHRHYFALTCPADAGSSAVRAEIYLWCDRLRARERLRMFRADGQDDIGLACEMVGGARPENADRARCARVVGGKARLAGDRFRRREYRAASRNRPALLRQRIAHAAATARTLWGVHPSGRLRWALWRQSVLVHQRRRGTDGLPPVRDLFLTFSRNGRLLSRCRTA